PYTTLFRSSTGNDFFATQNQSSITFDQSGIPTGGSNDTGANQVLSVTTTAGTTTYAATQLPVTLSVTNGSGVTYSYSDPVDTNPSIGKRYKLGTVTGPASGFSVSGNAS